MDGLFAFSEAMSKGGLSVNDLAEIIKVAIEGPAGLLHIQLLMAIGALKLCGKDADTERSSA
jgi:hypothetical protein